MEDFLKSKYHEKLTAATEKQREDQIYVDFLAECQNKTEDIDEINQRLRKATKDGYGYMPFKSFKHVMDDYYEHIGINPTAVKIAGYYALDRENKDTLYTCRALKNYTKFANRNSIYNACLLYTSRCV